MSNITFKNSDYTNYKQTNFVNKLCMPNNPNLRNLTFGKNIEMVSMNLLKINYKVPPPVAKITKFIKGVFVSNEGEKRGLYAGAFKILPDKFLSVAHLFSGINSKKSSIKSCKVTNELKIKLKKIMNLVIKDDSLDLVKLRLSGFKDNKHLRFAKIPLKPNEQAYIVSPHPGSKKPLIIPVKNIPILFPKVAKADKFGFASEYIKLKPDINIYPKIDYQGFCGAPVVNKKGKLVGLVNRGHQSDEHIYAVNANTIKDFLKKTN